MTDTDDLNALSSRELHDLAVHRARHHLDVAFLWEPLRPLPPGPAAATLCGRFPGDAEVCPVDLAGRGEASPGAAIGVWTEAVELDLQWHAAGNALQR